VILQIPKILDLSKSNNREKVIEPSTANHEKNIGCPPLMIKAFKLLRDFVNLSVGIKKYTNTPQKDDASAERKQCQNASKLMKESEKHKKLPLLLCLIYSLCSEYTARRGKAQYR
jgi:hypothetical protein